ncbi:MAG: hypothetical protein JSW71_13185 [Gemmatimonadota bacterium]|nr:MAG: hypothetical protein JSW71_13185 [Gemmatimonadota bacterium]
MGIIKRILGVFIILLALGSVTQCTNDRSVGPQDLESGGILQSIAPPRNAHWLSDYFALNPHQFGIRTYYWYDEEEHSVAFISGTETVPYTSGPIEATKLFLEDEEIGFYLDGRELWWPVIQDDYYVSVDCALTAFPFPLGGKVWDGMYVDLRGLPAFLVEKDGPGCIAMPENDRITLFKIDDVNIFGERYNNALILWSLEPEEYRPLDFGGYEDEWGITLPTREETRGNAVDGFAILGFQKGIVALGETSVDDGELDDLALLVSEVPTASVPVHWASGGGTIVWGGSGRVTYGFNVAADMAGNAGGVLQFNWRDGELKWHGAIDCLSVEGSQAYMSGELTNGQHAGSFFIFSVEDNGEGATATGPDLISVVRVRSTPRDCHGPYEAPFKDWTNGNVRIRSFR